VLTLNRKPHSLLLLLFLLLLLLLLLLLFLLLLVVFLLLLVVFLLLLLVFLLLVFLLLVVVFLQVLQRSEPRMSIIRFNAVAPDTVVEPLEHFVSQKSPDQTATKMGLLRRCPCFVFVRCVTALSSVPSSRRKLNSVVVASSLQSC
jgi:hypothetical protein